MSDWTHGYVAELGYTTGFYRELSPHLLNFVATIRGVRPPAIERGFTYCELGCGQGLSSIMMAAANPDGQFYAVDFNPSHITSARALASEAGIDNLTFIEHSFAELAAQKLPEFDYISLHGVYSWISVPNRQEVIRFIRDRLKPGGVVYISYNSLPGWSAIMPLRELMTRRAASTNGPLPARIDESINFAKRIKELNSAFFRYSPQAAGSLDDISGKARNYLAHEYFNQDWTNFYHSDVVAEMNDAKLRYIGAAFRPDDLDALAITQEARQYLAEIADPAFRETVRDFMVNRRFRTDLFMRGPVNMPPLEHLDRLKQMRFILTVHPDDVPRKGNFTLGEIGFADAVFNPVLTALGEGAKSFGELLEIPDVAVLGQNNVLEVLTLLVVLSHAMPIASQGDMAKVRQRTDALNLTIAAHSRRGVEIDYLASPVLASAVGCNLINRMFIQATRDQQELAAFAWKGLTERNLRLVDAAGQPIQDEESNLTELQRLAEQFETKHRQLFSNLGIL